MSAPAVSPDELLAPRGRPLFVFAHPGDELYLAGVFQRLASVGRVLFWTGGSEVASPSLERLGWARSRAEFASASSLETRRRLTHVPLSPGLRETAFEYFRACARALERGIESADPDRVFTLAWQGGDPEHDLAQVLTSRALRRLRRTVPLVEMPAAELASVIPFRFGPHRKRAVESVWLDRDERSAKRAVLAEHPSFERLGSLRLVVDGVCRLAQWSGRRLTLDDYFGREELRVVDPGFDYTRPPQGTSALDYLGERFEGIPFRFTSMVGPVAAELLAPPRRHFAGE